MSLFRLPLLFSKKWKINSLLKIIPTSILIIGLKIYKSKTLLKNISVNQLGLEVEKLEKDKNYWIVIVTGKTSSHQHYLYDGKVEPIIDLLSFSFNDFYIIDKKYEWLLYFHRTENNDTVAIYKSGTI